MTFRGLWFPEKGNTFAEGSFSGKRIFDSGLILRILHPIFLLVALLTLAGTTAYAQGEIKAITFTGLLTGGKNSEPLPNAYVYLPKAGRGTITNSYGYFSIPVYPGDSVVFSYVGYERQYHVVPRTNEQTYSRIIELKEDVTLLREVKVYPYPTEEEFKRAFLETRLADEKERENLAKNTDPRYLRQLAASMGMGSAANYRYFIEQQNNYTFNRTAVTTIPFLNPLAWASFIRSVKRGDLKRDDWKAGANSVPFQNLNRDQYIRQQSKQ